MSIATQDEVERRRAERLARRPEITFDGSLPIHACRSDLAEAIREHQVVIVAGETGSGKSTQLPKICLELGRGIEGMIGHTQPRRIAARSVAARVAEELGSPLGRDVGFKIRFTDATRPETYIKLMTDGILLAETQHDRELRQYDTIIIDEAHERSLNIDFLLGYIKRLLPRRPDLKLIITSATIDAERFASHFAKPVGKDEFHAAPVLKVSGRGYPIETLYRPLADEEGEQTDWQTAVADAVDEAASLGAGDMLVFLPTERHIRDLSHTLRGRAMAAAHTDRDILPLYARLSTAEQNRIFQSSNKRRIVLATNVAESSLTVPGIRYVIDLGLARISRYAPRSKVQRLPIEPISRASADQRQGRCGRVGPGVCLRLYAESDYNSRDEFTTPEIRRTNLAAVILQTLALKLGPIDEFPFLDPPASDAIRDGRATLFEIGAIDDSGELTPIGQQLAKLPIDPRLGRMILAGSEEGCLANVLVVAAGLAAQDPRERPVDKQQAADEAHAAFADGASDFVGMLKLWEQYHRWKRDLTKTQLRHACRRNFLSFNRLREWDELWRQLSDTVKRSSFRFDSNAAGETTVANALRGVRGAAKTFGNNSPRALAANATEGVRYSAEETYGPLHRAILAGLLSGIANRTDANEYTGAGGKFVLWPGAGPFNTRPKWVVAAELVETSRRYLRFVARIQPEWVEPLAEHLLKRSYSEPSWDKEAATTFAFERVTLYGLTLIAKRRVRYTHIDPAFCRELFIRHGLVEGDFQMRAAFLAHNRELLAELADLGAKTRKQDHLVDDDERFAFYHRRIPADVVDGSAFRKWLAKAIERDPRILYMQPADLLRENVAAVDEGAFPEKIDVNDASFPIGYRYEPGAADDGVTLTVPKEWLNVLSTERLGWLIPGLLEEKVVALIKSLPKAIRRGLVPAPDVAKRAILEMKLGEGSFLAAVASSLSRIANEHIPESAFDAERLPAHLRINVKVVDEAGATLAQGRDVAALQAELGAEASESFAQLGAEKWRSDGLTDWTFGELPASIELARGGVAARAWPALVDQESAVGLRLFDSSWKAAAANRAGLRRLFYLAEKRELLAQAAWLPGYSQLGLFASWHCDAKELERRLAERLAELAFMERKKAPRDEETFRAQLAEGRKAMPAAVAELTKVVGPLLEACHQARLAIEETGRLLPAYAREDLAEQFRLLTEGNFLVETPWRWLGGYSRYFKAIRQRIEKLRSGGAGKDQTNYSELAPKLRLWRERTTREGAEKLYDPELEMYRWMLEEFRVSLFAQQLGAAFPISAVRLDKQWAKVTP